MNGTSAQRKTIALFTTSFIGGSHYGVRMMDEMQKKLTAKGYYLVIHYVSEENLRRKTFPLSFYKEKTDAIVCFEILDIGYYQMICETGLPMVSIDAPADITSISLKADRIFMDNRSSIRMLIGDMVEKGKKKIGFVGGPFYSMSFFERYMAYRETLAFLEVPFDKKYSILGYRELSIHLDHELYKEYIEEKLNEMDELPDMFICADDNIAIDVLQIAREKGLAVPKNILLSGFGDTFESRIVTPSLTSVHIHSEIIGASAVYLLMTRIENPSLEYRTIYTETSLVSRESTGGHANQYCAYA